MIQLTLHHLQIDVGLAVPASDMLVVLLRILADSGLFLLVSIWFMLHSEWTRVSRTQKVRRQIRLMVGVNLR